MDPSGGIDDGFSTFSSASRGHPDQRSLLYNPWLLILHSHGQPSAATSEAVCCIELHVASSLGGVLPVRQSGIQPLKQFSNEIAYSGMLRSYSLGPALSNKAETSKDLQQF